MKVNIKNQRGFTLTPALFILSLMMIGGTTYLIYINNSNKSVRKIETSNVAKYAAETGLLQMKSQFARLNEVDEVSIPKKIINKWYNAEAFDSTPANPKFIFSSSAGNTLAAKPLRTAVNTARVSGYIDLKDGTGKVTSKYRISMEDGSLLGSGKTVTGSAITGKDKYGNDIWSNTLDKNYYKNEQSFRFGVRVDGFSLDSAGNNDKSSQSIYAVVQDPVSVSSDLSEGWSYGSPSGFLLSTNGYEPQTLPKIDRYLNLIGGQLITGPIHSNNRIDFEWEGNFDVFNASKPNNNDNFTVNALRDGAANTAENPHILIRKVVREIGQISSEITIYGNNFSTNIGENVLFFNGSSSGVYPASVVSNTKMIVA